MAYEDHLVAVAGEEIFCHICGQLNGYFVGDAYGTAWKEWPLVSVFCGCERPFGGAVLTWTGKLSGRPIEDLAAEPAATFVLRMAHGPRSLGGEG